jgi:hypothetical protein
MMVGARAFEEYALETGKRSVDSPMPPLGGTLGGPDLLRTQADQIVALLGSRYDTLVARHRRDHHHRLIELEHYARELARYMQFVPGTIDADPVKLSEMAAITSLFERWKHHPAIPELIDSLRSAEEVRHTIAVLTLSSFLVDHENGVGIFRRSSRDGRVADLWLAVTLIARLEIEVKAPQTLLGPLEQTLTYANAHRIVKAAFDNAASTRRGQLDPEHSGIVAIACYYLDDTSLDLLKTAAKQVVEAQTGRKLHVIAIVLVAIGYVLEGNGITPASTMYIVRHPGYRGWMQLDDAGE